MPECLQEDKKSTREMISVFLGDAKGPHVLSVSLPL